MKLRVAALLVFASCTPAPSVAPAPISPEAPATSTAPPEPSPTPLAGFDVQAAVGHIRHLTEAIGKRVAGSPGEKAAARYIEEQMRAAGLDVERQEFSRADGGVSANVIGRFPGVDYSQGFSVMGGHYDTKGESPGGNDNASGIGVILQIARALLHEGRPVELVAFAAEEVSPTSGKNHEGSRAYVDRMGERGLPVFMISVDMVANGTHLDLVSLRGRTPEVRDGLVALAGELGIAVKADVRGNISDHGPFAESGVPSALVWSGRHPSVHTAQDNMQVVQAEAVDRAGRLVLAWARSL